MKRIFCAVTMILAFIFLALVFVDKPLHVFAWGDNEGGRKNYTQSQIEEGILGNDIIFNTLSDNSIVGAGKDGNEQNFVAAREANGNNGAANVWNADEIKIEDGKEYIIRLYVHNNNPNGYGAIAENVHVSFSIPSVSQKSIEVNGFINSSNATPSEYWDHVNFVSDKAFHLDYVYGSALLANNGVGAGKGLVLSDDVVMAASGGTLIGYDDLDGKIPGGLDFASYVAIKVKAVVDTDYEINQEVRIAGDTDKTWKKEVNAKVGDKVEFQLEYLNADPNGMTHENVMVGNILPSNLKYILGSTRLWNELHNGDTINQDDLVTEKSINIGNYKAGANAFVRFTAEVVNENLANGSNVLVTWGDVTVKGFIIQDSARVRVKYDKFRIHKAVALAVAVACIFLVPVIIFLIKFIKLIREIKHFK